MFFDVKMFATRFMFFFSDSVFPSSESIAFLKYNRNEKERAQKCFCFSSPLCVRYTFSFFYTPPDDVIVKSFHSTSFLCVSHVHKLFWKHFRTCEKEFFDWLWIFLYEHFVGYSKIMSFYRIIPKWMHRNSPFSIVSLALEIIFIFRLRKLLKSKWLPVVASSTTT